MSDTDTSDPGPSLETLQAALRERPDDPELHLEHAAALAGVERWEEALTAVGEVMRLDPARAADPDLLRFEVRALTELDRYPDVLERAERLAALGHADDATVLFFRGVALNALGRHGEALTTLEDAARRQPPEASRGPLFVQRLSALVSLGRSPEALALAAEAEKAWTGPGPVGGVLFLKIVALNQVDRYREAVETVESAIASWPPGRSQEGLLVHAGLALNGLGRHAEALEALDRAQAQPTSGGLHDLMALQRIVALNGVGRHAEAVALADAVQPHWRGQQPIGFLFLQKAIALNESARPAEALVAAESAAAHWPADVPSDPPLLQQAVALNASREFERALAVLETVDAVRVRMLPPEVASFQRGVAQYHLDRLEEAAASLAHVPAAPPVIPALASALTGLALVRLDRAEAAETALVRAVELAPHLPAPLAGSVAFLLGAIELNSGRAEGAVERLALAVRLAPELGPAWNGLVTALLQVDRLDEARQASQQALGAATDGRARAQAWLAGAAVELRQGQLKAAARALGEAARHDASIPTTFDAAVLEATVRVQLGELERALHALDAVSADTPATRAWLQLMRGGIELQRGNLGAALAAYADVEALPEPPAPSAPLLLARAIAQISLGDARHAARLLDGARALSHDVERNGLYWLARALSASATGAAAEALEATDRGLPLLGPHAYQLRLPRGMALVALGRDDEALAEFDTALAELARRGMVAGWTAPFEIQKGFVRARRGELEAAVQAFRAARTAASDPLNRMSAVVGEGLTLASGGDRDGAVRVLRAAAPDSDALPPGTPHRGLLWWALGTVLASQSRDEEALAALTRASRLQPTDARIQFDRGCVHATFEEFETALAAFRISTSEARTDEERIRGLVGQGWTLVRLERHDEAVATYRAALDVDPEHSGVWQALGEAYAAERRHGAAHQAFRRAYRQGRGQPRGRRSSLAAVGVSGALLGLQKNQEAWQFLDRVRHEVEPDPRLDFNRGIALTRLRRYREAIQAFRAARELSGALDQIESLEARRSRARPWLDFWFGADASWTYRAAGAVMLLLLVALMAATLLDLTGIAMLARVKTEHAWKVMGALVAVLLLPSVARLKWGDVEIQALPAEITPEVPLAASVPASALDVLLGASSMIGSASVALIAQPPGGLERSPAARVDAVVQRTTLSAAASVPATASMAAPGRASATPWSSAPSRGPGR